MQIKVCKGIYTKSGNILYLSFLINPLNFRKHELDEIIMFKVGFYVIEDAKETVQKVLLFYFNFYIKLSTMQFKWSLILN